MTSRKELFLKWIKILFYVQCVALVATVIDWVPVIGSWFGWLISATSIVTIVVLFQLIPMNERYKKAVIFLSIAAITTFLLKLFLMLAVVGAIASIIGMYQEYMGHSEVMQEVNKKVGDSWQRLFYLDLVGGLCVSVIGSIIAVAIGVVAAVDISIDVTTVITQGYSFIFDVLYLLLLKHTYDKYKAYEPLHEAVALYEEMEE